MARIEDYALIGDCQTAALVSKSGSIDWLCLPRIDSGACFAALLGTPGNGRWSIAPRASVTRVSRRYREDTLVLETDMETEGGAVRLIDFMPLREDSAHVVRIVEGLRGTVRMATELVIRFDYGSIVPWVRRQRGALTAIAGPDLLALFSPVKLRGENLTSVGEFDVAEGQRVPFVLSHGASHLPPPKAIDADSALSATQRAWKRWMRRCAYRGPYEALVRRSLLTLKALTYAPTGGIVAAATTSLPERLGGARNWDYRFCWLRDSTLTLYALMNAGYRAEAAAWREWLLRAVAGEASQMKVLYRVAGERRTTELEVPWLDGYEGSKPVRVGNQASAQLQLDVYGEVIDTLYVSRKVGLEARRSTWRLEEELLGFLESRWRDADSGIWEVRGPPRSFTHSKLMVWVAADRAVKTIQHFGEKGDAARWRRLRDAVRADVLAHGYSAETGTFVQSYGSRALDASLLLLPHLGFLPARDPRVRRTIEAIERDLVDGGFVKRYATESGVDGLPAGEGRFLACSFWLADDLILLGRKADARAMFERLAGLCNDVGLLSEQYDPATRRLVGNFPQAFSHVALINTVKNLTSKKGPVHDRPRTK